MPNFIYRWIRKRGRIPKWVKVLWPGIHWCSAWPSFSLVNERGLINHYHWCCCTREEFLFGAETTPRL